MISLDGGLRIWDLVIGDGAWVVIIPVGASLSLLTRAVASFFSSFPLLGVFAGTNCAIGSLLLSAAKEAHPWPGVRRRGLGSGAGHPLCVLCLLSPGAGGGTWEGS